jgi:HNH endonuclease
MAQRQAIKKSIRFEVFKRDSFTCQYCGQKAPDVLLEIDHIEPVSKGGTNDLLNLLSACKGCNSGKSDRRLSDDSILEKQRKQLEELQERKEQIEMMFNWQKSLLNLDDSVTEQLSNYWSELVPNFSLNENGIKTLRKLRKSFELSEIMGAMKIASDTYITIHQGVTEQDSVELAWKKIGGICRLKKLEIESPDIKRLYYIRGILRNRLNYVNELEAMQLLREALLIGTKIESLENHAKQVTSWNKWCSDISDFIEKYQEQNNIL